MTQPEFRPLEIELSVDGASFTDLESLLLAHAGSDITLRDASPSDPVLRSSAWLSIVVALTSAGGVKAFKDVLMAYLESRRVSLTVRHGRDDATTIEGPLGRDQIERLLTKILDR
jgi:hypothetical protein